MPDTTYAIELKGLDVPEQVRKNIETALQNAVMAEIAKTDLSDKVKLAPLPAASERLAFLPGLGLPHLLGFILRGPLPLPVPVRSERDLGAGAAMLPFIGLPMLSEVPFGAANLLEVLEGLYMRPDVRAAIINNSRAFAELLSRDEQATKAFNELVGGLDTGPQTERAFPVLVLIYLACAAGGVGLGILSR